MKNLMSNVYMLLTLFKMMLDYSYWKATILYSYAGMKWDPRSVTEVLITYFITYFIYWLMPKNDRLPSSFLLFIMLIFMVVPMLTLYAYSKQFPFIALIYFLFIFIVIEIIMKLYSQKKYSFFKKYFNEKKYIVIVVSLYIIFNFLLIQHFGFKLNFTNDIGIYDIRNMFSENMTRGIAYIFNWMVFVLNPILFIFSVIKRKFIWMLFSIVIQLYFFSVGGHKSVLLNFGMIYLVYYFIQNNYNIKISILKIFVITFALLIIYDTMISDYSVITSVLTRRMFLVPAQMYYLYFDYFSNHEPDYFAQSFPFSMFYSSNYSQELAYLIGETYLNRNDLIVHANVNMFGDFFANLGWNAILMQPLIVAIWLISLDFLLGNKDRRIVWPLLTVLSINVANSAFISVMITHGFLFFMLMMSISPNRK